MRDEHRPEVADLDIVGLRQVALGFRRRCLELNRPHGNQLADIHHPWGDLLAHAARGTRLVPGDVIGSGTVGTGCILELGLVHGRDRYPYLVSGDEVELEVEGIGVLRNRIA